MNEDQKGLGGMPESSDGDKLVFQVKQFERNVNQSIDSLIEAVRQFRCEVECRISNLKHKHITDQYKIDDDE